MRTGSRNNVIAGAFVVAGVALAVAISIVLSGVTERLTPSRLYTVRFSTAEGAPGVDEGSPVTVGGLRVGTVTRTRLVHENGVASAVEAVIRVRRDLRPDKRSVAHIVQPILGGLSAINIADPVLMGAGVLGDPLEPGGVIPGRVAPPAFLASAGYGPEQATQVQAMIREAGEAIERINSMTKRVESDLEPDLALVRQTLEDARAAIADIRERTPEWTKQVDSVLASADRGAAEFQALGTDLRTRVEEARAVIADVQAFLDRNEASLDKIVADISSVTGKLDAESVRLLNDALRSAEEGAERFSSLAASADQLLREESPSLRRILANFRLASDQLKLAAVEIRTKPWLLLYEPKTKELESEVLQQAVRTYAAAVSDLRAASEALQSVAGSDGASQERVVTITEQLAEAFKKYKEAEDRLFELLMATRP